MPKLDPFFFSQLKRADFDAAVSSLQGKLSTLLDAQFEVALAQLVAMAGDAHTYLALDDAAAVAAGFQTFPLMFRWLDDGVFVAGASSDYSQAIGTRLIGVGSTGIDQVVQMIGSVIPHENLQWLHYRAQQYLRGRQILEGLGILTPGTPAPLTFQDLAGHQFTLQVSAGNQKMSFAPDTSSGNVPLYVALSGPNYSSFYNPALHLLYFRYVSCANDPSNPFPAFAQNLLQTLDSNPVDTLVFDLRDNTGGDASVIDPLLNGIQQRARTLLGNPAFRAYLFINKGTFSSGLDDAMELKSLALQAGNGAWLVVAGESSGGKPTHYGSVQGFTLPGSGLAGQYSTRVISAPAGIPDGGSFNPDVNVGMRSTDYFARFDPLIAESVARWSGATSNPSGSAIVVNGASFRVEEGLAPGSFASAFGTFEQTPDQILLGGTAGNVVSASGSQMNFVVPASIQPGTTEVSIRAGGEEIASGAVTVTAAGPGIFVLNAADPAQPGAIENQDYSVNSQSNPASAGSVIQIFATGHGPLDANANAPVTVVIGGAPAEVLYSGEIAQFAGLWQINARVPAASTEQLALYLIAGNMASNAVTLWVH